MTTSRTTCPLCEARCGLLVELDAGGAPIGVRGDTEDPLSRGHLCRKSRALVAQQASRRALARPLRRRGDRWVATDWDDTLEEVGQRLAAIQDQYGRDAVAVYFGNPVAFDYATMLHGKLLIDELGTANRYSAASLDGLPPMVAAQLMYGHHLLLPVPDLDRTAFLLVLGANPVVSNGSMMTAPGLARRLKSLRERGGHLVVVDPRRTATARMADEHVALRPGTDVLLLLALLHVVFADRLARPGRLRALARGWEELEGACEAFVPERVSVATGVRGATIRRLAHALAAAESAACYGRVGVSTQPFGATCAWLIGALNVVTGNLDRPGGAMFPQPAVDLVRLALLAREPRGFGAPARASGLPSFAGERPVAGLAAEIEAPGAGRVRALVSVAGNLAVSAPGATRLARAVEGLELYVSIDRRLTAGNARAHLVMPPAAPLTRDHYGLVTSAMAVRNTAKYTPAVVERGPDERHDWEILDGLRAAIAAARGLRRTPRSLAGAAVARVGHRRLLDVALRAGPYPRLSLRRLAHEPAGIDLGPLRPRLPAALRTPDRCIDLAPARLLADLWRAERLVARTPRDSDGLALVGRRLEATANSSLHGVLRPSSVTRATLLVHPVDAAVRGFTDGASVTVRAATGAVTAIVELSDEVRPGVVSLPHGWDAPNYNALTDPAQVDPASGTAVFSGIEVCVERAGE